MAMTPEKCHCGRPLHYTDPNVEDFVRKMIKLCGPTVIIEVSGRRFKVQRHYLALHGIRAAEIDRLGFEEVTGRE